MKNAIIDKNKLIEKDVAELVGKADILINDTIINISNELINLYWSIGKMIFEYKRVNNLQHGDSVVKNFSSELLLKHGAGFNYSNITRMINFYELFSKIAPGQQFKNSRWTHIRELLKFNDTKVIEFYLNEIEKKKLSKRQLIEFIKSKSYERTIVNQKKGNVKNKIEKTLKDPLILNIPNKKRTEKELENEIVKNVSNFKKEIGNIVTFYERQYKININGLIHKVDLVFLDYETNTFILVDLKINKVTNHDIMQMKLYIEYFSKELKNKKTNVIGLILCETKDLRLVENDSIYQIKYLNEIPKEKELLKIINDNKIIILKTENLKLDK